MGYAVISDIRYTATHWRLVHLLGITALRSRYTRSRFGQAWLSITTFVQILCTGLVWSLIWRMEIKEYLPYIGIGQIIYLFLSQTLNESCGVIVADSRIYMNDKLPFMVSIGAHVYRNLLILLHNIPTVILLLLWSNKVHPALTLDFLLGTFEALTLVIFASYLLAIICTRFRDLIQLVGLFFQLIFLVSPIMWKISFLPEKYQIYALLNPFASMVELIRNPLLGMPVNEWALIFLSGWTALAVVLAVWTYYKMNRHTIYWI